MPILIMALLALIILGIIGILLVVAVIMEHSPAEHPARRHRPHPASFDVAPSSGANMDKPRAALVEPSLSAISAAGIANTCTPGAAKSAGILAALYYSYISFTELPHFRLLVPLRMPCPLLLCGKR